MQKGFATFEVVLLMIIIVVMISVALPAAERMIDRVALDYETKRLYTDLRFVQSFDRMTNMRDSHFLTAEDEAVKVIIRTNYYRLEKNSDSKLYAEHYFSNGVTAGKAKSVMFDDMGKITPADSDTLYLTSRLGKKNSIVFDTVGRFRGGLAK